MPEILELHSEPYQPTGNQAGSGVRNQLGRPNLSQLAILIRETVQNSWDARLGNDEDVVYGIEYWNASGRQMSVLRDNIFRDTPAGGLSFGSLFQGGNVPLMTIFDRGTVGLSGPTKANIRPERGERNNFNNLIRNIGSAEQQEFSGGTYGFGKAALFQSSRLNTVVVHTSCVVEGHRESRLIAMALGEQFDDQGTPYTGRHWWGAKESHVPSEIAEPLIGSDADKLAAELGMPEFDPGETGTTILIIDPEFETANLQDAVTNVLLWNFWPKMLDSENKTSMKFRFDMFGESVDLPFPGDLPYLRPFIDSLNAVHLAENDDGHHSPPTRISQIASMRPRRRLGTLAITPARDISVPDDADDEELGTVPVDKPLRHVALMRRAELVVRYLPGPEHDVEGVHYGGVFITDPDVDEAFASSEPPTHDDWVPNSLQAGADRTSVNVGLREIRSEVIGFARPSNRSIDSTGAGPALGALSESLADLLPGEEGEALGGTPSEGRPGTGGGGGGSARRKSVVKTLGDGTLESIDGTPVLRIDFEVILGEDVSTVTVSADAAAAVDESGGTARETDVPTGMISPSIFGWVDPHGLVYEGSDSLPIDDDEAGEWAVLVGLADSAAVRVDIGIQEED